ncbi:MAG: hypothetical protein FJ225_04735 [Lentisphaerae bacterium]|nr:hypothetical protein [Lentisphaerota bacterium]
MADRRGWLLNLLLNNWPLKLLALVLAVATVYAVSGATNAEVVLPEVPIAVGVDAGIAILDQEPKTARVTFRGSSGDLLHLDQKQIRVALRASATDPRGSEVIEVTPEKVRYRASGVRVARVEPAAVRLVFDREVAKQVAVTRPEIKGVPLLGRAEIDYEPRTVAIRGPKRAIETVTFVTAEPVSVEGRAASFSTRARVLLPSEGGVAQVEPPEIAVKVSIVTETVTREWTNVNVLAVVDGALAARPVFAPPTVKVSLHGRKEVVSGIPAAAIRAFVDCTGLDVETSRELAVLVHVPAGLEAAATVDPSRVQVTFVKAEPAAVREEAGGEAEKSKANGAAADVAPPPDE